MLREILTHSLFLRQQVGTGTTVGRTSASRAWGRGRGAVSGRDPRWVWGRLDRARPTGRRRKSRGRAGPAHIAGAPPRRLRVIRQPGAAWPEATWSGSAIWAVALGDRGVLAVPWVPSFGWKANCQLRGWNGLSMNQRNQPDAGAKQGASLRVLGRSPRCSRLTGRRVARGGSLQRRNALIRPRPA